MGWQKTLDLVKMRFEGLQKIKTYFKADTIDFEECGGYEILNDDSILAQIDEVNETLKNITGIPKTYLVSNSKIEEFGLGKTKTLIENPLEGSLHSGKVLQQLLEKCHDLKVEFLFGTEVLDIAESEVSVKVSIENIELEAENIVIATMLLLKNYFQKLISFPHADKF